MQNNLRSWASLTAGLLLLTGGLAACGSSSDDTSSQGSSAGVNVDDCTDPDAATAKIDGDIKVGYSVALSGPVAGPVQISSAGYDARIKAANDAGGIDGHKIKIIYKDDAFAPDKAKANVVDLIENDKVDAVSTFGSGQLAAMADDQNAACVPMLYPSATNPDFFDINKYPWTVQFLPSADRETQYIVEAMKKKMGGTDFTIGVAANETASGQTNAENFEKNAKAAGLTVKVSVADTDPTAAATQLKAAGVDVVYHAGLTGTCASLNTAMARVGFTPKLVMMPSSCASAAEFVAAGAAAEGSTLPLFAKNPLNPGADADPAVQEYLKQMGGSDTSSNTVTVAGWVMADMLVHTLEEAAKSEDGLTHLSIIEAARDLEYTSPMFLDGVKWLSEPDKLTGISGFDAGVWDTKQQLFVPAGDVIQVP